MCEGVRVYEGIKLSLEKECNSTPQKIPCENSDHSQNAITC